MKQCRLLGVFVLFLGLVTSAWAVQVEPQSVSRIAFGPDNTLFIADWKGAQIIAVDLPSLSDKSSAPFNVMDFDTAVAKAVGSSDIRIEDLRARPGTNEAYVALSVGTMRRPVIVVAKSDGALQVLNLKGMKTQRIELKEVVDWKYEFWNHIPERSFTVTDMQWHGGKLYVAGLSNQNFASTLRVINYPFDGQQSMASVQIYHTSHDEMETRAPIREMTFTTLSGKDYLIAAYMCTPLVTIPLDEIHDGAQITGKTIAELGYGNTPDGLLAFTANEQGKNVDYLLVSNMERNAEVIPLQQVEDGNAKAGLDKWVPFGEITGVTPVQTPFAGVYRVDSLSPQYFIAIRRDLETGHSQLVTYDKNFRFRLSDFVSEYNFPGYEYKGQMQLGVIKTVEDALKKEEGYPVTSNPLVNGPFPPKK